MHLARLVVIVSKVRATTKKTEKIALLAEFLRRLKAKLLNSRPFISAVLFPKGKLALGGGLLKPRWLRARRPASR